MTKEINSNINYRLAKGILDMLLENRIITLTEYEEIDKKNKLSFA